MKNRDQEHTERPVMKCSEFARAVKVSRTDTRSRTKKMKIERRETFWKGKKQYLFCKGKNYEVWRDIEFDLETALEKYKGGKSRWLKKK